MAGAPMRRRFGGRRTYRKPVSRDANHGEIVAAFEELGCTVADLAGVGGGCPDILVGFRGVDQLVEIKDVPGPKGGLKNRHVDLSDEQVEWHRGWYGLRPQVVRTTADVVQLVADLAANVADSTGIASARLLARDGIYALAMERGMIPEHAPSAAQEPRGEAIAARPYTRPSRE